MNTSDEFWPNGCEIYHDDSKEKYRLEFSRDDGEKRTIFLHQAMLPSLLLAIQRNISPHNQSGIYKRRDKAPQETDEFLQARS